METIDRFNEIGLSLSEKEGSKIGKMFGKPSLNWGTKAFACLFDGDMVFKLSGLERERALAMSGAKLFDPGSMGRPMKEWVQVPGEYEEFWKELAASALEYVQLINK